MTTLQRRGPFIRLSLLQCGLALYQVVSLFQCGLALYQVVSLLQCGLALYQVVVSFRAVQVWSSSLLGRDTVIVWSSSLSGRVTSIVWSSTLSGRGSLSGCAGVVQLFIRSWFPFRLCRCGLALYQVVVPFRAVQQDLFTILWSLYQTVVSSSLSGSSSFFKLCMTYVLLYNAVVSLSDSGVYSSLSVSNFFSGCACNSLALYNLAASLSDSGFFQAVACCLLQKCPPLETARQKCVANRLIKRTVG